MIEHIVINGCDEKDRIRTAIRSCGPDSFKGMTRENIKLCIAEALASYGYFDPDDAWDGYRSHHTEVLQLENDGPMSFDGWKADKRLRDADLKAYVESVHLD